MPRLRFDGPLHYRLMARVVQEGDCWVWTASKFNSGYGKITFNERQMGAHRASWLVFRGDIPAGICVLHKCDNRPCVNPDHLFLGTNLDNVRDKQAKGRARPGRGRAFTINGLAVCMRGHPFHGDNVMKNGKHRTCRACCYMRRARKLTSAQRSGT